jgi:hypothetical protein
VRDDNWRTTAVVARRAPEPALRIARQRRVNQLLTKTADPKISMTRMAAKEMTARLEGEVAALRTVAELPARPTPMD